LAKAKLRYNLQIHFLIIHNPVDNIIGARQDLFCI